MGLRCGLVVVLAVGCGRVGFEPIAAKQAIDAPVAEPDAAPDAAALQIPPGARIWLRMDTGPSGGIVDSAGGHSASCVGTCPTRVAALHGDGYSFTMNEVDVQYAMDLDSSAGFTAAVWVRLAAMPSGTVCPWDKPFDNANAYDTFALCIDPSGASVFDCETPTGTTDSESGPQLALGTWHHLAMTWDGMTKRGYFDGTQVVSKTVKIGSGTLALGLGAVRSSYHVTATLDDAVYYTRALSAAEIAQLASP